jgi:hypothetical protein
MLRWIEPEKQCIYWKNQKHKSYLCMCSSKIFRKEEFLISNESQPRKINENNIMKAKQYYKKLNSDIVIGNLVCRTCHYKIEREIVEELIIEELDEKEIENINEKKRNIENIEKEPIKQ